MAIDLLQYALAFTITGDPRISLVSAAVGRSPAAIALLAVAAGQRQTGTTGTTATPTPAPRVGPGTTVVVTPQRVQVPELPDDQDEAIQVLNNHGLVGTIEEVMSDEPIDVVIGSDPPAETVVRIGSAVTVLVSAGAKVPDVTGKELKDAESILRAAGFKVGETKVSTTVGRENVVASQDPAGGSFADSDSAVELTLFKPRRKLEAADSHKSTS